MAGPLVAIVGETGSGKSDLAQQIALEFDGEIICADAWTIRKGMDIGTAKPSLEDQKKVTHHMLDLVYPNKEFSAAEFQKQTSRIINNMHKRNKLPVLVGGSGLYIDSVLYNYGFLTTVSETKRDTLNKLSIEDLKQIIKKEHISLAGVDELNKRRLIRLIETKGQPSSKHKLIDGALVIGLSIDKEILKDRLESRLNKMIKDGLEKEVRQLSQEYGWEIEAMKGVGYREWQDYLVGSINESALKQRIIIDSLKLAKKQRTWFKRNKDITWLNTPVNWSQVVDLVTTHTKQQV